VEKPQSDQGKEAAERKPALADKVNHRLHADKKKERKRGPGKA
jgi:hypothetical protein